MGDIDKLDPAHIVRTCSQKHVQSVIEDLVEEVRRKHAEVELLKAALAGKGTKWRSTDN